MPQQLLFLEFNEINFEDIEYYCQQGVLPNLNRLIANHGWTKTRSEQRYEELEPWIQWVTAHTGKSLAEHGVFRLGDITKHDLPQIWERLEAHGLRVGAISPMNAKHRLRAPAFFVPDPWTRTELTANARLRGLYDAIVQAVNDNAEARLTIRSARQLILGMLAYARVANYPWYAQLAATAVSAPWRKAILLDVLLADVFLAEVRRTSPHFATLFLNAGAHIQHHYLFSAASYRGKSSNPAWYLRPGRDPVREVYQAYDRILGAVQRAFPNARLMIATGLHQEPHGQVTYYWRLRRHSEFLARVGIEFQRVEPRMSRDFLIVCSSSAQAAEAGRRLAAAKTGEGVALFEVDNRGTDLFVMLTYPGEIAGRLQFAIDDQLHWLGSEDVAFVALKNGEHDGVGYFLDSGQYFQKGSEAAAFALADMPNRVLDAMGIAPGAAAASKNLDAGASAALTA
ncbi:hypothetical protein [Steroidobacter sp.]|uniref:hypothetical protein n=1 Tax=Steroidobacter sp. TaxID=1978227 RepID=UPI001A5C76AA|nr:hypothetical protein [Steroidobacter sp.]MBL8267301.1 hypothetical protein [Steroidobacter sp.]